MKKETRAFTMQIKQQLKSSRPHATSYALIRPQKEDVAPPQPTPSDLEELIQQHLRAWPKVHLREVRQLLQHSGYRLSGDRRAQKMKQRLMAGRGVEVPAVVAEGEVKADGGGEEKKEERKGKVGLVKLMERLMVGEDMEMGDV
ncbi:hypothetical protein RUND412_005069 [Rhizina undulata]